MQYNAPYNAFLTQYSGTMKQIYNAVCTQCSEHSGLAGTTGPVETHLSSHIHHPHSHCQLSTISTIIINIVHCLFHTWKRILDCTSSKYVLFCNFLLMSDSLILSKGCCRQKTAVKLAANRDKALKYICGTLDLFLKPLKGFCIPTTVQDIT